MNNDEVTIHSNDKVTIYAVGSASASVTAGSVTLVPTSAGGRSIVLRRTPRTARGYIEPLLEIADALPLHMVLIPSGTFIMGSPEDEPEREEREGPQHEVTVPQFFIGQYPITQAQWRAVAALPRVERKLNPDPSSFKGDNHPVERVTWYEAVEFCQRLVEHTGREYRLPTEAEWEYACRAGTTTPFYFGKTLTTEVANYNGKSTYNDGPKGEYRQTTTPVDHFGIANAFGLSDMHGNVYEWCQDHYHRSYEGAPTDGSAWLTSDGKATRVRRGGSRLSLPMLCRSAFRYPYTPVSRGNSIGFRVVCSAPRALQ
ncbi:MAG: formylglycine-generating enzyme family protein [Leptolyngbya sp. SIO4C1]|nr:formylglycine-generating enzyme family protein [Leptolyngbya sp. SIO4C1]